MGFLEKFTDTSVAGVNIYGGPRASSLLSLPAARSFHYEYNSTACTVEIVDDVYAAIDHIYEHGRYVGISVQFRCIFFLLSHSVSLD